MLERRNAQVAIGVIVLATMIVLGLIWSREKAKGPSGASAAVPIVMHTSGGRLEVATITVKETFKLADSSELFGINLGTTVSHVHVDVVYRYHIEMAKEWPIKLAEKAALVEAGEIKPNLPVAFDTRAMEKYTANGWARFNKQENLEKLERSLSPQLEARAHEYKNLATHAARKTISDFVTTWLLKEQKWKQDSGHRVEVVFRGDVSSAP